MRSSNFSYLFKLIFVFVLISAGFLSFLKETVFVERKVEKTEVEKVLGQVAIQNPSLDSLQSEIKAVKSIPTNDFTVHVPVLMYHYIRPAVPVTEALNYSLSITPEALDRQLAYIAQNGYQTISLNDLSDSLENHTPLPPKSVILTFDDGYRDFYTSAFPLLKKYNLRAVSFYVVSYFNYPNYMNWDMVQEIHSSGLVDVESHTLGHLLLTKLKPEQARAEIFESKRILEEQLQKKVNYFAYPYGDLNEQVVALVKEAGYKLAFGTKVGSDLHSSESLILKRIPVDGFDSLEVFRSKLDS